MGWTQQLNPASQLETGRPLLPDTICRFYSMTKVIVTVTAMQLWEEGYFDLDDAISKHIPEWHDNLNVLVPETPSEDGSHGQVLSRKQKVTVLDREYLLDVEPAKRPITVRDLVAHTSGLEYGFNESEVASLYRELALDLPHSILSEAASPRLGFPRCLK
eukprot:gene17531-20876_t